MKTIFRRVFIILIIIAAQPVYAFSLKCTAQHKLMHDDTVINASYQFFLHKGKGVIKIEGTYKDTEYAYHVSREVKVNYSEKQGVLSLENKGILQYPLEDVPADKLRKHYPVFFMEKGKKLTMIVEKVKKNSFSLTYNTQPLFFCSNLK